jgi:hypothetical protein
LRLEIDDPSWEEMRSRAKFIASLIPVGISRRCALVIGLHQYGIARMEAAHLEYEGMQTEVFRDLDEAREWLTGATIPAAASAKKPKARSKQPEPFTSGAGRDALRPTT